jgi:hypothetical protein
MKTTLNPTTNAMPVVMADVRPDVTVPPDAPASAG